MSLLKRLNAENAAVGGATPAGTTKTMTGPAQTAPVGTGELFARPATAAMSTPTSTGELFQNAPKQTSRIVEQAQQPQAQRRSNTAKQDSFNEIKGRVQNRLIAELDPRMDLGNADEVRRTG